jgi:hypothetical protein
MRFRRSSALPFAAYIALVLAACTSTQPVVLSPDPVQPISPGDRLRVMAFLGYIGGCRNCDGDERPLTGAVGFVIGGGLGALAGMLAGTVRRGFWETVY